MIDNDGSPAFSSDLTPGSADRTTALHTLGIQQSPVTPAFQMILNLDAKLL